MPSNLRSSATATARADAVEVVVGDRPVVALVPGQGRVKVGLVVPVVGRIVDVGVQPATATTALAEAASRAGVPMSSVDRTARRALAEAAERAAAWSPGPEVCLLRSFGGVAFPLLAAAYDEGAAPLAEVPRWAGPVLAAASIREAATTAFGASATRTVRRALVEAIRPLPSGELDLTTLGLALMAGDVLEPDRLSRVLRAERVPRPVSQLPDRTALAAARPVLLDWGPERAERVLVEAAGRADGVALLLATLDHARQLGDHGPPRPLPHRLGELHDVHRTLMRGMAAGRARHPAAGARHPATPPPAPQAPPTPTARRAHRAPDRPLAPPLAAMPVSRDTPIAPPAAVRALDGHRVGELTFVLPHTVGDLHRWGRLLSNCLADFGAAAATGRSVLVGVLSANRLAYAIELTPGGTIRQFCGAANRPPPDDVRRTAVDALIAAGAVAPSRR